MPSLASSLDRALLRGQLVPVLPGIYRDAARPLDLPTRVRAALLFDPDAVVTGRAAAALTWWPELAPETADLATRGRRQDGDGIRWHQGRVPADLVLERGALRVTGPPLTVLDLLPSVGGLAIDEALRRRVVTLEGLERTFAALPRRRGDRLRRELLDDSRDEPWSEAERHFHRCVRALDLPCRPHMNYAVTLPDGTLRIVDCALPDLLLGFEVDGYAWHGTRAAFVRDRASDAQLAALNWLRVRFDANTVLDDPQGVQRTILAVVAAREALLRGLTRIGPPRRPRP